MQYRKLSLALAGVVLAAGSFAANAAVVFTNLGVNAPPATLGTYTVTAFDQAPQAAIPEYTATTAIPGNPAPGTLVLSPAGQKLTVGSTWWSGHPTAWGHGYTGVVYYASSVTTQLTLPADTKAFYFYVQPNTGGTWQVTATSDSGTTSGPIPVTSWFGEGAANGFAFHATAGENITSITISIPGGGGMAIGEFGIATGASTTCASEGYTGTKLLWCQNICEKGYTGATLQTWIHRWVRQFRDLPYCAVEPS